MNELRCYVCNKTNQELKPEDDLRPYGVNGQPICCTCAKTDPIRWTEAQKRINMRLNEIFGRGGIPVISDNAYTIEDLREKES